MTTISISSMSDRELLERTVRVAGQERHLTADLLALIGEFDTRRLYLGEGCSSLFTYCTQVLHFSEHAAYHRIEGARAARQFPIILELIAEGAVTFARGGPTSVENLALRCRGHNGFECELAFGASLPLA